MKVRFNKFWVSALEAKNIVLRTTVALRCAGRAKLQLKNVRVSRHVGDHVIDGGYD